MNLQLKSLLVASASALLLAGCGGGAHGAAHAHEGELVFKGTVAKVHFMVTRDKTIIVDADGKETELEGMTGIPCAEVEIYRMHGHEYEVFQGSEPLKVE